MSMLENISERILDNGLKVICLQKTDAPLVAVQLWYKTGSVNERDGIRGISHFIEHMMFRGSENVAPEEHARRINDVGGHCNAFTAEDMTAYINSVPADHLEMVLDLEADRMRSLTLDTAILETERKVLVEEYHTYMNNPVMKAFLEFRGELFKGHPYAISSLGSLQDIQTITSEDCRDYYDKWYSPANAVCIVVGDFESEDHVFGLVDKKLGVFESSSRGANLEQKDIPEVQIGQGPFAMKHRVDFDVPLFIIGYPAPKSSDKDALPLEMLQLIVSHGESSRLYREMVRKRSLAVMAGGINHFLRLSGMSLFFAAFTPDVSVKRIEEALNEQIENAKRGAVTALEVEKVKNGTLTNRIFELYSAENICQRIGFSEAIEGDYRLWVERLEALENLTVERLIEVAEKYWDIKNRYSLYLQPKKVNPLLYVAGFARRLFQGKGKA
ncbi:MAG: hypothetical protein GF401_07985 [Chitinivibrionales bacterium]|nr:hypothetical protein [Chitinivibrionales bacterium]